jgi:hypothetical protein
MSVLGNGLRFFLKTETKFFEKRKAGQGSNSSPGPWTMFEERLHFDGAGPAFLPTLDTMPRFPKLSGLVRVGYQLPSSLHPILNSIKYARKIPGKEGEPGQTGWSLGWS